MSLRRQSCNTCFRERRKCDLAYPVCKRCQKRVKNCTYVYPPQVWQTQRDNQPNGSAIVRSNVGRLQHPATLSIPLSSTSLQPPPPQLDTSLPWIYNLLRESPLTFAARGENVFIHKALSQSGAPCPLLTAFAICAACASLTSHNRHIFFQALDSQMTELILTMAANKTKSLLDDLARLQAAVLYQIMRLFYGQIEHQMVSEREEYVVRAWALRLLHRVNTIEGARTQTWEEWILAESVRRTVFVTFKMYTVYMGYRYGRCAEAAALEMLPVSRKPARAWQSREFYHEWQGSLTAGRVGDDTTTAAAFATDLAVVARPELGVFERVVVSAVRKSAGGKLAAKCQDRDALLASAPEVLG